MQSKVKYKTDKDLVNACVQGKRDAQEVLYKTYADKMFAICKTYAQNRDDACEYLQLGFIQVFTKLNQFSFTGSLEGWIRRVIVTTALQELRKQKHYQVNIDDLNISHYTEEDEIEGFQGLPFNKVIEYVNELPKKAGLVLKLFAIEGYSHQEIAKQLSISISTSKSQLNYARSLLKKRVSDLNG